MESTSKPRVKICCISSVGEAHLAIRHGASALGLVSEMPSGPGVIEERVIAEIEDIIHNIDQAARVALDNIAAEEAVLRKTAAVDLQKFDSVGS